VARRQGKRRQVPVKPVDTAIPLDYESLLATITQTHDHAQRQAVQAVNTALTLRNWLIGYHIVEYEQHGRDRAQYGERLLDNLAKDLRRRLAFRQARQDADNQPSRGAFAMEDRAVMLWKVALACSTVELSPGAATGMAVGA
jgi:DUF1016 N-terminal domain